MTSYLFVGKTASGIVKIYVGRTDELGRLSKWFISGIPAIKTDVSDIRVIERLAREMVIEWFPARIDFEQYVAEIKPNSWGRYGVAASKKESPERVLESEIDPWCSK